jgi:hypothetical protein
MEGGGAAVGGGEANRRPSGNLPLCHASPAGYCTPSPGMAAGIVVGFLIDLLLLAPVPLQEEGELCYDVAVACRFGRVRAATVP